jgi:hypothetical protein
MIRNLKVLGLMAVAALALSVMVASTAQAAPNGILTAGLTPGTHTSVILTGEQYGAATENYFETFSGSRIHCENSGVKFIGSSTGTSTRVTGVSPTYKDCVATTAAGTLPATVTANECTYSFNQPEAQGGDTTWKSTVDLVCPAGKSIEVEIYQTGTSTAHHTKLCTITLEPKTNMSHVLFHNKPAEGITKDDLTAKITLSGISYEEHGVLCPDGNTVTRTDWFYNSTVTIKAEQADGTQDDLWISTATVSSP